MVALATSRDVSRIVIIHAMRCRPHLPLLLCTLFLAGCATRPLPPPASTVDGTPPVVVAETYVTAESPADELDSLATWPAPDGTVWLIATAKVAHQLAVFDADSGERLRTIGGEGTAPGQFKRPNGVFVHGDHLFVSERDNRRVQVFLLPEFTPLGTFGEAQLRTPYGLWLHETGPDELEVYVTDSFQYGKRFDQVPPFAELDQRVRHYRLRFDGDRRFAADYIGAFGDTSEAHALRMVESIAGDASNDRLLIADEDTRHLATVHEYSLDGRPTGRRMPPGTFAAEPEGIALWACPGGTGYWIVADQLNPHTIFRVFDRGTLAPRGAFVGNVVAWTDGIGLHAAATPRFPGGVLFAVHADKAIGAFDLRDVVTALQLDPACVR